MPYQHTRRRHARADLIAYAYLPWACIVIALTIVALLIVPLAGGWDAVTEAFTCR